MDLIDKNADVSKNGNGKRYAVKYYYITQVSEVYRADSAEEAEAAAIQSNQQWDESYKSIVEDFNYIKDIREVKGVKALSSIARAEEIPEDTTLVEGVVKEEPEEQVPDEQEGQEAQGGLDPATDGLEEDGHGYDFCMAGV